jgi:hypothetical protein
MSKKLTETQKRQIHSQMTEKKAGATALADEYGVSRTTIYRARDEIEQLQDRAGPFGEFGLTGLTRFGGTVREDYHRDWQMLDKMVPLVKEMLDHPIVGAVTFAVEMSIRGAEWTVTPAGEDSADQEAAEFIRECFEDMSHTWDDHISQATSMLPYGFAPFEIVYKKRLGLDTDPASKYDDGKIGWRKFAFRAQDTLTPGDEWVFDENGGIQGMNQTAPPLWSKVSIPIEKMILYRTTAAKNNPQGRSALRSAYIPWYYSKNLAEIEGIAAERMGTGLPVMYLGDGTRLKGAESDFEFAKKAVRDVKTDEQMGLVLPFPKMTTDGRGVLFELVSPPSRGMIDFHKTIERYNQQIAQVLLAQFIFLGLTEIGTQALVVELTEFFSDSITGWLKAIADTLNQHVIPRLFRLNATTGMSAFPKFEVGQIGDLDVKGILESLQIAVDSNVLDPDEGTERVVRQLLDLPQADSPEAGKSLSEIRPPEPVVVAPNGRPTEEFAVRRGRREWELRVNAYQRELSQTYQEWSDDLAADLEFADEDEREEIVAAALLLLGGRMSELGTDRIEEGMLLGLGDADLSALLSDRIAFRQAENIRYINDSLLPDLSTGILAGLSDPAVIGLGMFGFSQLLKPKTARVEQYAGAMWGAIAEGVGEASRQQEDGRVYWRLDPRAEHCDDCLNYGEQEYASFESMTAMTGGAMPGSGVQCDGNCRCTLEIIREGEFERP